MLEDFVVSFIPGRVRLRHPVLTDADLAKEIIPMLSAFPGVETIEHKALTGSLLVIYDPEVLSEEAITALLEQGEEWLKENTPQNTDHAIQETNTEKMCFAPSALTSSLTRSQKRKIFYGAMTGSFFTMLFTGGTGSKKAHYTAGIIFAGLTALHMWRMRKTL